MMTGQSESTPAATSTGSPARSYPLARPDVDDRFTFGLLIDVARALTAHGYPPLTGRDLVELRQALFGLIYAPAPDSPEATR